MLVKITSADESVEERSYDVSGRLIRKTESLYGEIISSYNYTYDEWGNITKIEHEEKEGDILMRYNCTIVNNNDEELTIKIGDIYYGFC